MRPATFYAGIITAIIVMFASLAILASIPVTKPTPPEPFRGPLIITASAVDVTAPQPHKMPADRRQALRLAKRKMRGPRQVSRQ